MDELYSFLMSRGYGAVVAGILICSILAFLLLIVVSLMLRRVWKLARTGFAALSSTGGTSFGTLKAKLPPLTKLTPSSPVDSRFISAAVKVALSYVLLWCVCFLLFGTVGKIALVVAASFTVAFYAFLFSFVVRPGLVARLTNDPNRERPGGPEKDFTDASAIPYKSSEFGFFIPLAQGQCVEIETLGGGLVRFVMRASGGSMFLGDRPTNNLRPTQQAYSVIVPTKWRDAAGKEWVGSSYPIPFPVKEMTILWLLYSPFSLLWWMWKHWMLNVFDVVFTLYPWGRVHVYALEHYQDKMVKGKTETERRFNYSNHFRIARTAFPLVCSNVDSQNLVEMRVKLVLQIRIFWAHLARFNTDDNWSAQLRATITNALNVYAKTRPYNRIAATPDFVAPKDMTPEQAREMEERLKREIQLVLQEVGIRPDKTLDEAWLLEHGDENPQEMFGNKSSTCVYGILIEEVQVEDVTVTDENLKKSLAGQAQAAVDAANIVTIGDAQAKALEAQGRVLQNFPSAAAVVDAEARKAISLNLGKTSGNIGIFGGGTGNGTDQAVLAAILAELKRINEKK